MTDLLCSWLNQEVAAGISNDSFADECSNGYLFGLILNKYGLQDDFKFFSKGRSSDAKLNNFTRLEPTLNLLDIPFDSNKAHEVMLGRRTTATQLMYQIFVAVNKKKQYRLTGQSIESMRPPGRVKLERVQADFYHQRLKQHTPRQVDLEFQKLINKYQDLHRQRVERITQQDQAEEEKLAKERRETCMEGLEKSRQLRQKYFKKLKPLSSPPATGTAKNLNMEQTVMNDGDSAAMEERRRRIAMDTKAGIDEFEATHNLTSPLTEDTEQSPTTAYSPTTMQAQTESYMQEIKQRTMESTVSRTERERRRRKILMDQLTALQEQEDAARERMLVERLMRQCLQERRIATQLMHIRKEKEILRNNRIERQKQFEEERMREFEAALQRIAVEGRMEEEEQAMKQRVAAEFRRKSLLEKREQKYQKRFTECMSVLDQVVQLSCKMAEYRELTQGLIPAKFVRDWKLLFLRGQPLYEGVMLREKEDVEEQRKLSTSSSGSGPASGETANDILDEADLNEYLSTDKEWSPPDHMTTALPPANSILSHIVYRLIDMVHPPKPPPSPPSFPRFVLRTAFIGPPLTGKSSSLERIANMLGVHRIVVEQLIAKAIDVYKSESVPASESHLVSASGTSDSGGEIEPVVEVRIEDCEAPTPQLSSNTKIESGDNELSRLALLGHQALDAVTNGDSVDDTVVTELLLHEIRTLPDDSCWILDGYPTTLQQAQLLTERLTGQATSIIKEQSEHAMQLTQQFKLITNREIQDEELQKLHSVCGLDLVVWFTASTDTIFQRSSAIAGAEEGEKTDQIQQRMLTCDDNLKKLKSWYQQFRTLANINANQDIDTVCEAVVQLFQGIYDKVMNLEKMKKHGINVSPDKLQPEGLASRSMIMKPQPTPHKTDKSQSQRHLQAGKQRRPSSAGSTMEQKLRRMKSQSAHVPSAESELLQLATISPVALPGSPEWRYCYLPLNKQLAGSLAEKWPAIEQTYLVTIRRVANMQRQERENICRYIYARRCEYHQYLHRPDHKQEFLTQWQQHYNTIPDLQRRETLMKAELHHRVNDLCDKLWDISDHRKSEAERERAIIMADQWVEDHVGILSNHYITLMQCELDKYQDTVLLLKDYYVAMESAVPTPLSDALRLPIIQIPETSPQEISASAASSQHSIAASSKGDIEGGAGDTVKTDKTPAPSATPKRVPRLPRQTPVPEPDEKEKGGKKKGVSMDPLPPVEDLTGLNLDDQLIVHVYNIAINAVFTLNAAEVRTIKNASAEDNKKIEPPEPVKEEKPAKGKKGKSPPAKKGKATPPKKGGKGGGNTEANEPPPGPPPQSAEEIAQRQKLEHMRKEHLGALEHEERTVKARLELIKEKSIEFIQHLKEKLSATHSDMEQWIGDCYQHEVDSVTKMAEVLRQAIEKEEKLLYKLVLSGASFHINEGITTFTPSPPSPPPPSHEPSHPSHFTTPQLSSLHHHLLAAAPSGFILASTLVDTLCALSNRTYGDGTMPLEWTGLNKQQITEVCSRLYGSEVEYVDWRRLLLCLIHPLPRPSPDDLVSALQEFVAVSHAPGGAVTREEFGRVRLWFTDESSDQEKIKQVLFDILKDQKTKQLNYESMLLYMSTSPDPLEGLFKALTVVTATPLSPPPPPPPSDLLIPQEAVCKVFTHSSYSGPQLDNAKAMLNEVYHTIIAATTTTTSSTDSSTCVPLNLLLQQPLILEILGSCSQYTTPDTGLLQTQQPSTTSLGT